jgi:hypothetical protein
MTDLVAALAWPVVALVALVFAVVAYRDWAARKTDWNGSVSVGLDHINHALKTLRANVERNDKNVGDAALVTQKMAARLDEAEVRAKKLEEAVDGHTRAIQAGAAKQHRSIL